jgi:hypothetical protein
MASHVFGARDDGAAARIPSVVDEPVSISRIICVEAHRDLQQCLAGLRVGYRLRRVCARREIGRCTTRHQQSNGECGAGIDNPVRLTSMHEVGA